MLDASTQSVLFVLGFVVAAVAFITLVFAANALLSPRKPTTEKNLPYECGMEQAGTPWAPVRMRFSTLAVLFVIFDAEAVLLYAVATRVKGSVAGLIEVGLFVAFLAVGLVYAWRKGALEWH
jgi:NADH-quinone oxidoreductase subunit A